MIGKGIGGGADPIKRIPLTAIPLFDLPTQATAAQALGGRGG
jgi:hypothetical protein